VFEEVIKNYAFKYRYTELICHYIYIYTHINIYILKTSAL